MDESTLDSAWVAVLVKGASPLGLVLGLIRMRVVASVLGLLKVGYSLRVINDLLCLLQWLHGKIGYYPCCC